MKPSSGHRTGLKDVNSDSANRNRDRRSRLSQELRKDARSRLISAKRARPNPHQRSTQHLHSIDECMQALRDHEQRLLALKSFRHILEEHPTPSVIPALADIISSDDAEAEITEEAIWCLNVLAHGYDALSVIEIAPVLLHQLEKRLPGLKASTWTIANLAADNPGNRHRLRALGAIDLVLDVLQDAPSLEIGRIAAWALCNLIRGQNTPDELRSIIQGRLPAVLVRLGSDALDHGRLQILAELLWIFTYLTAGDPDHARYLLDIGLGPVLFRALQYDGAVSPEQERALNDAQLAALRSVGNVVSGPDPIVERLLQQGPSFVAVLARFLDSPSPAVVKETMWALSNITGGPANQALEIIRADLLGKIVTLFRTATFDIQKECGFALYNLARIEVAFDRIWNCQVLDQFLNLMRARDGEAAELGFKFVKLALRQVPGDGAVQALRDNDAQAVLEDLRLVREDLQPEANAIIDQYLDPYDDILPESAVESPIPWSDPVTASNYPPWRVGAHQQH